MHKTILIFYKYKNNNNSCRNIKIYLKRLKIMLFKDRCRQKLKNITIKILDSSSR